MPTCNVRGRHRCCVTHDACILGNVMLVVSMMHTVKREALYRWHSTDGTACWTRVVASVWSVVALATT